MSPATLRSCADQLAPVFAALFDKSLEKCHVPQCFKTSSMVPIPKKPSIARLKDYRPVALTSVVMKMIERLVLRPERSLCMWILEFLQDRPQSVRVDKLTSKITLNVGACRGVCIHLCYSYC